ncbi:long-chain fatty acid--CoA ligase [Candidatus Bathyarchaeota archaeon]|nr:MAG: long-chain fatty acid--CoA ligase [Candidatus Bathyarchaeota archaeon]
MMDVSMGLKISSWKYPEKKAAIFEHGEIIKSITYKELDERVNRLANALMSFGVKKGDKVAYLTYNCLEAVEIIQALIRAGIVLVPINYRLTLENMKYIINHCDAEVMIVEDELLGTIAPIMEDLKKIKHYIVIGEEVPSNMLSYEDFISGGSPEDPDVYIKPSDLCYIGYTSGTTGLPKGVMVSHKALLENMRHAVMRGWSREGVNPEKRVLLVLMPLVHSNSIWSTSITFWYGGTNVIYRAPGGKFDAEEVLRLIDKYKVTTTSVVPAMLLSMLELPDEVKKKYDVSSVESIGSGSAMLYPSTIKKVVNFFKNIRLSNSYGSTETGPVTTLRHKDIIQGRKLDTVGQVLPGIEVKILDENGKECPPGVVGQIWVKTPMAFLGYYKDPEKTAKAIKGEWVTAGDLGWFDEDGYLHLAERSDDVIVTGGEHVASTEVENVLMEHPAVYECAVVGLPHEKWGQAVTAFVKLREGMKASEDELVQWCKERIARFKAPKKIVFMDDFPRTLTGKILKRILREQHKTLFLSSE